MGIHQMLLRMKEQVSFTDRSVYGGVLGPPSATATAGYQVESGGSVTEIINGAPASYVETWLLDGVNSAYEIRATYVSGTVTSGTVGSWLVLSTSRAWTVQRTSAAAGVKACTMTMECRRVSDGVIIDTWTLALTAETAV